MPTVALATEFFDAFAALPRAQQKKVREFTAKFQANPTSAAIHYEKIHDVKDDKVRTVRIDQKYRAVVLHPEQGDVHVLVCVVPGHCVETCRGPRAHRLTYLMVSPELHVTPCSPGATPFS